MLPLFKQSTPCTGFQISRLHHTIKLKVAPRGLFANPTAATALAMSETLDQTIPDLVYADDAGPHQGEKGAARAKQFYDDQDSQTFYSQIWGTETVHVGRYDLLTDREKATLDRRRQIVRAQQHHETEYLKLIRDKFGDDKKVICVADFGCGYGGLLRRMWEEGMLASATGVDIATQMCRHARELNVDRGCDKVINIKEESFLETSIPDNSVDLVISMEALLHVGPQGQLKAVQEASRILKKGGWMIFNDLMQQEDVDKEEMQPIYDRICLSEMGTVDHYKFNFESTGFENFEFLPYSSNVAAHYGAVLEVLEEKGYELGLGKEFQEKMKEGLKAWVKLAPKNILWGFVAAQKQ